MKKRVVLWTLLLSILGGRFALHGAANHVCQPERTA